MQGTVYNQNIFDRLGNALRAFKAAPTPGQMYAPAQTVQTGFLTFPGWDYLEKNTPGNARDENNARLAIKNPWVYRNANAIAQEVSTAELVMKQRNGEDEEDVENHPLEQLWEAPNPYMGRAFLMQFWTWQLLMFGEAYLYFVPAGGAPAEIWPIPSYMMTPVPDAKTFIKAYMFRAKPGTDPIPIDSQYICYSRLPNPFDIRRGLSPLVAAMVDIAGDNAMAAWNANFFSKENAAPTGIMAVPKDTLDSDVVRIRQEVQDFFGGSQRRVAVARAGDLTWTAIDRSQKDMEFLAGREFTSKVIDTIFGIPEGYWSKDATRANSEGAKATMIENAVWPKLEMLREDLNAQIVPLWYGADMRAGFNDIRPRNRALELQEFGAWSTVLTVNELRGLIDKDELDDPRGLMLLSEVSKGTPMPATPAQQATDDYVTEQEAALAAEMPEEEAPAEEAAPPVETPPILGYHIEQGVVSRNEARERLALPPEDESQSQWLRALQSNLSVVKVATEVGIPLEAALKLVGLNISVQAEEPEPAPGGFPPKQPPALPKEEAPPEDGAIPLDAETPPLEEGGTVEELPMKGLKACPHCTELSPLEAVHCIGCGKRFSRSREEDTRLWEKRALKGLRIGKPDVRFESTTIPLQTQVLIHEGLAKATTVEDVRAAFKAGEEDSLIDSEWAGALAWAKRVRAD